MLSEVRLISFFIVLVLAAVSDIRKREIPDGIPLLVTIVSLIPLESVQLSGLLVALPLLMIGVTAGGIGGGDIKLTGACGLVLGFGRTLIGLITGIMVFNVNPSSLAAPISSMPSINGIFTSVSNISIFFP